MVRKDEIKLLFDRLWPIHRSITGEGNRQTLKILSELVPLKIHEVPSGKKLSGGCVDWSHDLVVANIEDHSLDYIWNQMTNEIRRQHIHNDFSKDSPCFDCDYRTKRTKYDRIYNKTGKLNKIYNC